MFAYLRAQRLWARAWRLTLLRTYPQTTSSGIAARLSLLTSADVACERPVTLSARNAIRVSTARKE